MSYTEEARQLTERNKRIVKWTFDAPDKELQLWEDEVYWGFWRNAGQESVKPPEALFFHEADARAYQQLLGLDDSYVGPMVLELQARDNGDVPK